VKNKPLIKISITQPCLENWDKMPFAGQGRYCNNCNKTIIDYTKFTDAELFEFISLHKTIPCGRFHPHQLNVAIQSPVKKKDEKNWPYKIAASVAAFLSFGSLSATAQKTPVEITIQLSKKTNTTDTVRNKLIISGNIIDEHNNKLEKVKVIFNNNVVAETNKDGNFEFEVHDVANKSHLLQFSYPEHLIVSRSFHPVMKSTRYDVVLEKPHEHFTGTMGVPLPILLNFPDTAISFKFNDKNLSIESDSLIAELATQMRNNPGTTITITGEVNSNKEMTTCRRMTMLVRKKLIESEGISPERIIFIENPVITKKQNVLRIESVRED